MSKYIQSSNPFDENDEDEDSDFVMVNNRNSASRKTNYSSSKTYNTNPYSSHGSEWNTTGDSNPFDQRRENIQRQIDNSENTQLESTQRALASIYDSEAMGVATAEELMRQGETLDSIEKKTENIQTTLKTSQRHLNNIKSVFGGIKNWWKGDKNTQSEQPAPSRSNLKETIAKSENYVDKPKADFRGFYDDDDDNDLNARFMANAPKSSSVGGYSTITPVTRSAREEELDQNLGLMCDGMGRLKGLAEGLGKEIEMQNEQLDKINIKVDKTGDMVQNQNTQIRKILRK